MEAMTDEQILRDLEEAFREPDITDEMLDAWNAFDNHRFATRVQQLIDAHPKAAALNRQSAWRKPSP
jgi:hypothetical protein